MKVLIVNGSENFLVDLAELKPKTLRQVIIEAGDDELYGAEVSSLTKVDLDMMLSNALKPKAEAPKADKAKPAATGNAAPTFNRADVVAWGKTKGYDINLTRGKIKQAYLDEYAKYLKDKK